jgi:hypothetical protein
MYVRMHAIRSMYQEAARAKTFHAVALEDPAVKARQGCFTGTKKNSVASR